MAYMEKLRWIYETDSMRSDATIKCFSRWWCAGRWWCRQYHTCINKNAPFIKKMQIIVNHLQC